MILILSFCLQSGGQQNQHPVFGHVLTSVNIIRSDSNVTLSGVENTNQVIKGEKYTINFTFTNNTGYDFTITEVDDGSDMAGFIKNADDDGSCKENLTVSFQGQCHIIGIYKPEKPGNTLQDLSFSIKYKFFDDEEYSGSAESRQEVMVIAGQFEYTRNGMAITSLSLIAAPGYEKKETIDLINHGKAPISGMTVTIPPEIASYVSKAGCDALSLLGAGLSCDLTVTLPKQTDLPAQIGGQYAITATSNNADNTPAILYLDFLTEGHLSITLNGETGSRHTLAPGTEGTFIVENTGGAAVTNFALESPSDISFYFPKADNHCRNNDGSPFTLGTGQYCDIGYTVPASPDNGTYTLTFKGENADNSPSSVLTLVTSEGHLIFSRDGLVTNSFNTLTGESGTIAIRNQGSNAITNFSVDIPNSINNDQYITGNTCIRKDKILAVDASCEIKYKIPPEADNGIYTLEVKGNDFDNNDPSFLLTVLDSKPLYSFDFLPGYIHGNKVESNIPGLSSLTLKCYTSEDPNCKPPVVDQTGPKGLNNAISFDGYRQYAQFDDTDNIVGGVNGFTIDFWARFDSFAHAWSRIFDIGNGDYSDNISIYSYDVGDGFVLNIIRGTYGQTSTYYEDQTDIFIRDFWKLNQWVHVTVAVDGLGQVSVYRSGKYIDLNAPPIGISIGRADQPKKEVPPLKRLKSYIGKSNVGIHNNFEGKISSLAIYKGKVPPYQPVTASGVSVRGEGTIRLPEKVAKDAIYNAAFTFYNESAEYSVHVKNTIWSKKDSLAIVQGSEQNGCLDEIPPNGSCSVSTKVKILGDPGDNLNLEASLSYDRASPIEGEPASEVVKPVSTSSTVAAIVVNGDASVSLPENALAETTYPVVFVFSNTGSLSAEINTTPFSVCQNGNDITAGFASNCSPVLASGESCQIYGEYQTSAVSGPAEITATLNYHMPDDPADKYFSKAITKTSVSDVNVTATAFLPLAPDTEKNVEYPVTFRFGSEGTLPATNLTVLPVDFTDFTVKSNTCEGLSELSPKGGTQDTCEISGVFKTGSSGLHRLSVKLGYNTDRSVMAETSTTTIDQLYLYIANHAKPNDNSRIVRCTINSTLSEPVNCLQALSIDNDTGYDTIDAFSLDISKQTGYAFVATRKSSSQVSSCKINGSRTFEQCGMALDVDENNKFYKDINGGGVSALIVEPVTHRVFITDCPANKLFVCNQGSNGKLSGCINAAENSSPAPAFNCPHGLGFSKGSQYIYVSNYNGKNVTKCKVKPSGNLNKCENMDVKPEGKTITPQYMTINLSGTHAYLISSAGEKKGVVKCSIHSDTGLWTDCAFTATDYNFSDPLDVKLNPQETRAYISNVNTNTIVVCNINSDSGELHNCRPFKSEQQFAAPTALAISGW